MQKDMKNNQGDKEIKLEAFRQHWNQMRHTENLRHGFTSFYALIVVGILAFVSQTPQINHLTVYVAGAVLSLLGFGFSWRAKHSLEIHREKAISLVKDLSPERDVEKFVPFTPESGFWGWVPIRKLLLTLYALGFLAFMALIFKEIVSN